MPELPEVETVCRYLDKTALDDVIESISLHAARLRMPLDYDRLKQVERAKIISIKRRAKYILVNLDSGFTLFIHLGMSGRLYVCDRMLHEKHNHVTIKLRSGRYINFIDPRRFGMIDLVATEDLAAHKSFSHLGIEPLDDGFESYDLHKDLRDKSTNIKSFLLDQTNVVGIGNIYALELLFLAKVLPTRICKSITVGESALIVKYARQVLLDAVSAGGSTLRDYFRPNGEKGFFQMQHKVYGRGKLPCYVCFSAIEVIRQGGRSSFFCPRCQG